MHLKSRMRLYVLMIFLLLIFLAISRGDEVSLKKNWNMTSGNTCTKLESYVEDVITPRNKIVRIPYRYICLSIPPMCTGYKMETVKENVTISVTKTRIAIDCCKGYEKKNKSCVPTCLFGCSHGECVEPDVCLCDEGWRGENCLQQCERNRYGRGCMENCSCQHEAACDRRNGFCYCKPGYIGAFCELPCAEGTFGPNCNNKCECLNGGICDNIDGFCECQPGYIGDYCEDKCKPGTHGAGCEETCVCISDSTESCSHVDGMCVCKPGFRGNSCQYACGNMTYGLNCSQECHCDHAVFCDPVDGECFCERGWTGHNCSKKCPEGFFGEDCLYRCVPCINESTCNHVTGYCDCPPGSYGTFCDKECPEGYWGSNCTENCTCSENGACCIETGECTCEPGWIGENCTDMCRDGWFGLNCSLACSCSNTNSCHPVTGNCSEFLRSEHFSDYRSIVGKLIIVFALLGILSFVFLIVYKRHHLRALTFRNCCRTSIFESGGTSRENIISGITFPNPLYDRNVNVGKEERNSDAKRSSFVNIASSVRERLSSIRNTETPRSSSCDNVLECDLTLKRTSKISNLSGIASYDKLPETTPDSTQASDEDICKDTPKRASQQSNASVLGRSDSKKKSPRKKKPESNVYEEFVPESMKDFNTPEIIIENIYDYPQKDLSKVYPKTE